MHPDEWFWFIDNTPRYWKDFRTKAQVDRVVIAERVRRAFAGEAPLVPQRVILTDDDFRSMGIRPPSKQKEDLMNAIDKLVASGSVATVGDMIADDLVLVFDTETTGIPNFSSPSDHVDQPHIVSLAAELCRSDGTVIETYNQIVNVGVPIPQDTIAIHGITDEIAAARGIPPKQMLADFFALVERASIVVGYNTGFDLRMVRIQSARHLGQKWDCPIPKDDAMWIVVKEMKVKKPKLTAAYEMVFGRTFEGAHNALADTTAAREIYFEMRKRGYVGENPRALPGGNMPPPDETPVVEAAPVDDGLTPFERIKKEIDDLYAEAKNFLDGEPIANEGQASAIAQLREKIRDAEKRGEKMRKEEAEVWDAGKKAVQERFNPLVKDKTGLCAMAISTCNNALAPWLRKIEDDQKKAADAARAIADAAALKARDAAIEASRSTNIEQRESAEDMLKQASSALKTATRAETAKPQVQGATRAVGMKSVFTPELVDPAKAIEHYRATRPAQLKEWLRQQAADDVRSGSRGDSIPGFHISEERVPV